MAKIGEETGLVFVDTNVTDDHPRLIDKTLATGYNCSYFIDTNDNNKLYSTGQNDYGQLGLGYRGTTDVNTYTYTGIDDVKSIHTMSASVIIMKNDGTVWGAGLNMGGQLGLGSNLDYAISFTKLPIDNVASVHTYSGAAASFMIKKDGTLWATGYNVAGQLGLGDNTVRRVYTDTGMTNVASVTVGYNHTIIMLKNGEIYSAGKNANYQLLLGDTIDRNTFTLVSDISGVKKIVCASFNTMILFEEGTVSVIGLNGVGQFGLGHNNTVTTLTDTGMTDVNDITMGSQGIALSYVHTVLLKDDGSVYTAGHNGYGELGLGDTTDRWVFTDTGKTALAIQPSSIIDLNNSILAVGYNLSGALGLGDFTNRNVYTDTLKDTEYNEFPVAYYNGDLVQLNDRLYSVLNIDDEPSTVYDLVDVSSVNQYKPFDGENITPATHDGSISDMQYTIKGSEEFNAFTLSKILATSVTYSFTLPVGHAEYALWLDGVEVASGGNGIVKTATAQIDCTRDTAGVLSLYPTTVIYYADRQMPTDSLVTISLSHGSTIQLGDFTLNNTVSNGMTHMSFNHTIQDYNDYTPDAFGRIAQGVKPVVTKFSVNIHVSIDNYDRMVSLHESLVRHFVTIDGSDSNNGGRVFDSLTRRVLITNVTSKTVVTDDELEQYGIISLSAREVV